MKKILFIAFLSVIVISCKKDAAFPEVIQQDNIEQITTANPNTSASVIDQHLDFPGPYDLINECSGETVTVTGTIGIDIHIVMNGNMMNYSEHQQGHLTGSGSFGNTYVTNLNENITLNGLSSNNGVFIINDVTIFRMISSSGGANFIFRRNAHLTVNANGVVTVDRVDAEGVCQ